MEYKIVWVGLLDIRERKIVMTREKDSNLFQLPGGGMDEGESELQTLSREIKEELCVDIKNAKKYSEFILPGRHEGVMIKFIIYTASLPKLLKCGDDIDEIRLVGSDYVKNNLDIGNPAKLVLIPKLLQEGLID